MTTFMNALNVFVNSALARSIVAAAGFISVFTIGLAMFLELIMSDTEYPLFFYFVSVFQMIASLCFMFYFAVKEKEGFSY